MQEDDERVDHQEESHLPVPLQPVAVCVLTSSGYMTNYTAMVKKLQWSLNWLENEQKYNVINYKNVNKK